MHVHVSENNFNILQVTIIYEEKVYTVMVNNFTDINKITRYFSPHIIEYINDHDIWCGNAGLG